MRGVDRVASKSRGDLLELLVESVHDSGVHVVCGDSDVACDLQDLLR